MEEESYDEEVLLENSPLSQYLREACPGQEFETIPAVSDKRTPVQTSGNHFDNGPIQLLKVKEGAHKFLQWIFPPVSKFIEEVNAEFLPQYSSLALDSQVLLDADRQMILAYCPKGSLDTTHHSPPNQHNVAWMVSHALCAVAVLIGTLSAVLSFLAVKLPTLLYFTLGFLIPATCSAAYAFHWTRAYWILNGLRGLHKRSIECTGQCLQLLDNQWGLMKKSIRYIQEVEVISRGFTMVSQHTPIVRLENAASSKWHRQCLALRVACFHAARTQFTALRDATLRAMRQRPLVADIDHVGNYLALVALDDITPWIKVADDDEKQDTLSELTGCFSLAALKAMNSLFLEQRSEFIRRLILCTCPDARPGNPISSDAQNSWLRIVQEVSAASESSLAKLQRSYDCHRQRPGCRRDGDPAQRAPQGGRDRTAQHRASCAIRSLRLHLEATLNRVISLEETLEGHDKDSNSPGSDDSIKSLTSEMLETVKRELGASQDCLQEAVSAIEKMTSKNQGMMRQHKQEGSSDQRSDVDADNREPILLVPLRDTEIEFDDQIFEAYTDNEPWERCDDEWGETMSDQERIRRQREAEETKRMLQELRSVLSVRQTERERMISERNHCTQRTKSRVESSGNTRDTDDGAIPGLMTAAAESSPQGMLETGTNAIDTDLADEGLLDSSSCSATAEASDVQDCETILATQDASSGFLKNTDDSDAVVLGTVMSPSESHISIAGDRKMVGSSGGICGYPSHGSNEGSSSPAFTEKSTAYTKQPDREMEPEVSGNNRTSFRAANSIIDSRVPGCFPNESDQLAENSSTAEGAASAGVGTHSLRTEEQKRFGLPFLPSLSRHCRQEEETFFGSDEDSDESGETEELLQG